MTSKNTPNQKVKNLRIKLKLPQQQVADFLWINRVSLSQIENWEREIKIWELQKFSELFDIDVNELLNPSTNIKQKKPSEKDKHYKLKQLIIYISTKLTAKQNFGETLLNKLLYFIDFDYYERTGSLITDETYVKLPYGPIPNDMKKILTSMQKDGLIKITTREYFWKKQKTIIPLVDADISFLEEINQNNNITQDNYEPYPDLPHPKKLIKSILDKYGSRNADALSDRSHGDIPYKATKKIWDIIQPWLVFYREWWYITNPHNLSED